MQTSADHWSEDSEDITVTKPYTLILYIKVCLQVLKSNATWKKMYQVFCGSRGRCMNLMKASWVWRLKVLKWEGCLELESSELNRPLWSTSGFCFRLVARDYCQAALWVVIGAKFWQEEKKCKEWKILDIWICCTGSGNFESKFHCSAKMPKQTTQFYSAKTLVVHLICKVTLVTVS